MNRVRATDEWYESEEAPRIAMIAEVQRIRRRTRARLGPVLALATAITLLITYRLATRVTMVEAEVVLALTEGTLSAKHSGLPVEELREFVGTVLIPDSKLLELVKRRDLYPQRERLGDQYAIDALRSQIEIQIWKNSFVYDDEDTDQAGHSARIGITVTDTDPDRAYTLARELASIVIDSAQVQGQQLAKNLSTEITQARAQMTERLDRLDRQISEKQVAFAAARKSGKQNLVQTIDLELSQLNYERTAGSKTLGDLGSSRDAIAERISAAGLDMTVQVVEEHRPDRAEHNGFVLAMIAVILAIGSLLASALLFGVFDSRVHDVDDVARLGLPVLGHLPGFPGDHVGSLEARGIGRRRVPSFSRWASHR